MRSVLLLGVFGTVGLVIGCSDSSNGADGAVTSVDAGPCTEGVPGVHVLATFHDVVFAGWPQSGVIDYSNSTEQTFSYSVGDAGVGGTTVVEVRLPYGAGAAAGTAHLHVTGGQHDCLDKDFEADLSSCVVVEGTATCCDCPDAGPADAH
jgi:hypothetical protein